MFRLAVLLGLIFTAFAASMYAPFIYDDLHFVSGNPSVKMERPVSISGGRALTITTYRLNYLFGGLEPFGYHAVNIAIHTVNSLLVLLFLLPMIGKFSGFLAAGIFALHPLQSEAVVYISGRSELLATMFLLLAFLSLQLIPGRFRWVVAALDFMLAVLSKESALIGLPLLLVVVFYDLHSMPVRWSKGLLVGIALWTALSVRMVAVAGFLPSGRSVLEHAVIQNAQFWFYVTRLAYPVGLSLDHDPEMISNGLRLLAGLCTITAICLVVERADRRFCLWALWVAIALAPRFLINIPEYLTEHHLYLPFVGIAALCALGIEKLLEFHERLSYGNNYSA